MKQAKKYIILFVVCFLTYFSVRYFFHGKLQIVESLVVAAMSVIIVLVISRKK